MKKVVSLFLAVVMTAMLAVPVFADDVVHWVTVITVTDDAVIDENFGAQITEDEMFAAVAASEGIVGKSYKHMSLLYQRRIRCDEEICDLALRVWGSRNLCALLFFKGVEDEEWTLIGRNIGEVIDVCMFANGEIAVAYAS